MSGPKIDGVWIHVNTPSFDESNDWRIKPEPKPDVVKYIQFDADSIGPVVYIDDNLENPLSQWDFTLKVVIDGETGKLKKAEVL